MTSLRWPRLVGAVLLAAAAQTAYAQAPSTQAWPERTIVAVADSSYAALAFLAACGAWRTPVTVITRLRLDSALYAPAPPRQPGQTGRPRLKGQRLSTLAARAKQCERKHGDPRIPPCGATRGRSA